MSNSFSEVFKSSKLILNEAYGSDATYMKSANGAYIEDTNGKEYIDMCLGAGTHILGHNNPIVTDQINYQIKLGSLFIAPNPMACAFSETLNKATGFERFVFCNTGAEATMRAMRIARAYSGKKKIALFSGGWHGSHDSGLFDDNFSSQSTVGETCFKSSGILEELRSLTIMLPYNTDEAIDIIRRKASDIALVIIEPSQGSNPRADVGGFLTSLRKVTSEKDVLLCFDEVITGFRVSLGGAMEHYNIFPDLCTYGKAVGGGLPVGIVTGKKEILDYVSNGKEIMPTFFGGTFSANPLSMATGNAVVSHLLENKSYIYSKLETQSNRLKDGINEYCISNNIAARMTGFKSMMRLIFTDKHINSRKERELFELNNDKQIEFYQALKRVGIYVGNNGIIFLSVAHDNNIIDRVIDGFCIPLKKHIK
jgi:glutamate-1-semialdehyde 2,1-aminomutase